VACYGGALGTSRLLRGSLLDGVRTAIGLDGALCLLAAAVAAAGLGGRRVSGGGERSR